MKKHYKVVVPVVSAVALLCVSLGLFGKSDMNISATSSAIEDIQGIVGQYTLNEDSMEAEVYQINLATAELVDSEIINKEETNIASDSEGLVNVVERDWSKYSSNTPYLQMSAAEQEFYDRLTILAEYYINNSTIDAYYVSAYDMYALNGVAYDDLGLTSTQAFLTAKWFLYNNPQYYFLRPKFLTTSQAVYIGCYDIVYDGDDRANVTNTMFAMIDSWIVSINDTEVTNYDKLVTAHDITCNQLAYISNDYDQSLYSAVMMNESVCAGYSELMGVLLNASGVDTVIAISDCHAWNVVLMDDYKYYGVDATWDDSLHNRMFMACGSETFNKYDTTAKEHVIGSHWVTWVPSLSVNDYKHSSSSETETITVDKPTVVVEDLGSGAIRIKWSAVDSASKYEIEVYDADTNSLLGSKSITSCSLKLTNIKDNQNLYIKCRAGKSVNGVMYYSDWAEVHYKNESKTEEVVTVAVPTNIKANDITETSANVIWDKVSGADKYLVEIYSDAAYSKLLLSTERQNPLAEFVSLNSDTTYYVRVCSVKSVNNKTYTSDWSKVSFKTLAKKVIDVVEPTNLSVIDITESSGRVTWTSVADATKYELQVSLNSDFSDIAVSGNVSSCRVNITGLQGNTKYYVRVRTVQAVDGELLYSEWVDTSFTSNIKLSAPTGLKAAKISSTATRLSWTAVNSATSYEVKVYSDSARTKLMASANVKSTSLKLTGLKAGTKYYISIRSVFNNGTSTYYSTWVNASIQK